MRLSERHERWIQATFAALYFTGGAWIMLRYGVAEEGPDSAWSAARAWMLRAHGAAAMLTLIALGSLLASHVPAAWRARTNLASGSAMLAIMAVLTLTGWLLYYASGEALREASSYLHMAIGSVTPLLFLWHLAYRRRASPSATSAARRPL